jgi:hypothetical protein
MSKLPIALWLAAAACISAQNAPRLPPLQIERGPAAVREIEERRFVYAQGAEPEATIISRYDADSRLIERSVASAEGGEAIVEGYAYGPDGIASYEQKSGDTQLRYVYAYDRGKVSRIEAYTGKELLAFWEYVRSGAGRLLARALKDPRGIVLELVMYSGDAAYAPTGFELFGPEGELAERAFARESREGRIGSLERRDAEGAVVSREEWLYDVEGRVTRYSREGPEGIAIVEATRYDARGLIVERETRRASEKPERIVYEYAFDARGSWIEREELSISEAFGGLPVGFAKTKRIIRYR